jgi:diadenosine tetraphosphatase ApaH/serine/threonine PP2A family protein phosphatase
VRILLLSDIHSNLEALEACLAAAPAHDAVANLGDIVGYGASPIEVLSRSRSLGGTFVRGNHDKAVAGLADMQYFNPIAGAAVLWTREVLPATEIEWLRALPQGPVTVPAAGDIHLVHGSPLDEDEYVVSARDAVDPLQQLAVNLTFFGHTHAQGLFFWNGTEVASLRPVYQNKDGVERWDYSLETGSRYLINPGSVGQPRDGDWRAAFAVLDSDAFAMEFYRVPYDVKTTQEKILAAHLPQRLALRLTAGR